MISIVIPALNAESDIATALAALRTGVDTGLVDEIIVADGGSADRTPAIAAGAGARVIESTPGRGRQLAAGASAASAPWLLFLHADTVLDDGWEKVVRRYVETPQNRRRAAVFRFTLDDRGRMARFLTVLVAWRFAWFRLPYGDQGLLIARTFYEELGGFGDMSLMEDVDMVRRIGGRNIDLLDAAAVTSAKRYRREGYIPRMLRNGLCISLYFLGCPPRWISRIYD